MDRTVKDYSLITLKGIAMGAADVIPGVSGGTIAFISGIYEELINSKKSVNFSSLKLLLTGRFADFWKAINGTFLISLFTGIAISIISLAKGLKYLLDHHPILVWSFFFGLVVASTIYNLTITLLSGFMVGSLNKVWPWKKVVETFTDRHGEIKPLIEENVLPATYEQITGNDSSLLGAVALAIFGFVLIFVIENIANKLKK